MKKQIFNDTAISKEILCHRKTETIIGAFFESILPIFPILIGFIQPLEFRDLI